MLLRWSVPILLVVAATIVEIGAITAEDEFCNITDCYFDHIACGYNGEFDPSCENPKAVEMKPLIRLILDRHNTQRNEVASGKTHLPAAGRMAQMRWDRDLAHFAQIVANTCKLKFGKKHCRATTRFRLIGEIAGGFGYEGKERPAEHIAAQLMDMWFKTAEYLNEGKIKKYAKNPGSRAALLFTDRNNHVGCGASRYIKNKMNYFALICNYASNNVHGRRVYEEPNEHPADKCKIKNHLFPNLCHPHEKYVLN